VAEEGDEEEVELLRLGEVLDAGVAEADGFALGFGEDGDVGFRREGEAEAGGLHAGAELGVGVDVDDDAVLDEADFGLVGVDEAGGVGVAAEVVAAVGAVEELLGESALEGVGGDADLDGAGGEGRGCEAQQEGWERARKVQHCLQHTVRLGLRFLGCCIQVWFPVRVVFAGGGFAW
jgi:hypothetical protein